MTREEAIKALENTPIAPTYGYSFNDISDALYMAIEALNRVSYENDTKVKSCSKDSDLINRAEAAEISEVMLKTVTDQKIKIGISRLWQQIKDLPSADRPQGEWIYWRGEDRIKRCKCSRCLTSYGCLDTPYCPNCGAKMDKGKSKETNTDDNTITEAVNDITKWRTWSHTYDNACMNGERSEE